MTDEKTIIFCAYMFLSAPFTTSLMIHTFFNLMFRWINDRNTILEDTKEFYSNKKHLVMAIIFFPTTLGVYFIMSVFYIFGKSFDFLEK
ncbi:metabolite-proton symporter [Clostridium botulinum B str. Osaka05]|uniref:Metabolite-proton symporter n=1 Tax=Clostridium botulinum B str. Osaka05 TaxID=1407017 RepID=A0A060N8P2_CLOBO|nr:hypothetical protein [Clostridium botulinum]BAO04828.1 metabolite-proton symporter [Clostridium botulinum B str. Osaka05]